MMNGFTNTDVTENKYYRHYWMIICNARDRDTSLIKGELHHIVPRSMGGSENSENIVKLSYKEHYICHYLLTKFTVGIHWRKMISAFTYMNTPHRGKRYFNSRLFESHRKNIAIVSSERMKEFFSNPENLDQHRQKMKHSWINGSRDKQLAYMKKNSPWTNPEIHRKSIEARTRNGTNVFVTNNPMLRDDTKRKKVEQTSGNNHYLRKRRKFYYSKDGGETWILIEIRNKGLNKALSDLGFKPPTYYKMLQMGESFSPKSGSMKGLRAKRVIIDENKKD